MRNISIKWRMTLWFSLLMIAITALMLVFVMLMNRNTVTRPPEAELLYMVGRNADDVEFDHGDWDFSDVEQYAHGVYTEIFDEDGQRLFGTAPAEVSDGAPKEKNALHTVVGSSDGMYLVYDCWLEIGGSGLWVRGTIDSAARGSVMEVIVPLAWSVLPALVVLSVGGGWLISSSSFKPMEKVIAAAESISGGEDLSRRIGLPRGRSEINRLAGTFDDMFDRLERSFKAEAQFTSDASHELRTPVTVILAECETLERTAETTEDYVEGMTVIHRAAAAHHTAGAGHAEDLHGARRPDSAGGGGMRAAENDRAGGRGPDLRRAGERGGTDGRDTDDPAAEQSHFQRLPVRQRRRTRPCDRPPDGQLRRAVRQRRWRGHPAGPAGKDMAALLSGGRGPQRRRGHRAGAVHGTPDRTAPRRYGGGGERARAGQHIHRADPGGMTYIFPACVRGNFFHIPY